MSTPSIYYPFTPITKSPINAKWPNGKQLAVYFVMGVESYRFGDGITEDLMPGMEQPDFANTSWRDYGNRVGAFRIQKRFTDFGVPLSILLNTDVYNEAPELTDYFRAAGSSMIAHGLSNSDTLAGRGRENEQHYLQQVADNISEKEGAPPLGWSSPWLTHTESTIELLAETGYQYVLDWRMDDRPVWLSTSQGPLLHIPYALELNDSSTIIGRQASASEFCEMIIDEFDELLLASSDQPLVMSVVVHSFISGQPFRLRALTRAVEHMLEQSEKVWFTQPDEICKAVEANPQYAV